MSLLRFLGLGTPDGAGDGAELASVRRIIDALERMDPDGARRLARFAYVLGRVAHADSAVGAEETRAMERILMDRGRLSEAQAALVVQIAKSQNALFGGTDDYLVTREFAAGATREEKLALLDCCFAVSAADRAIGGEEEVELKQIATQLGLTQADLVAARGAYRDYLAVLKRPGA
ncbi:MAG TPA: TerB family tellurite resistance protein [Candidatus Limnocylindria bacterium]|nr:TerB family tellurite resistance protein [Candidatus Limnocylindria bacterium]